MLDLGKVVGTDAPDGTNGFNIEVSSTGNSESTFALTFTDRAHSITASNLIARRPTITSSYPTNRQHPIEVKIQYPGENPVVVALPKFYVPQRFNILIPAHTALPMTLTELDNYITEPYQEKTFVHITPNLRAPGMERFRNGVYDPSSAELYLTFNEDPYSSAGITDETPINCDLFFDVYVSPVDALIVIM